jgi:hypothetical protein
MHMHTHICTHMLTCTHNMCSTLAPIVSGSCGVCGCVDPQSPRVGSPVGGRGGLGMGPGPGPTRVHVLIRGFQFVPTTACVTLGGSIVWTCSPDGTETHRVEEVRGRGALGCWVGVACGTRWVWCVCA